MQLLVKTLRGTTITLQVERSTTVEWIKAQLQVKGVLERGGRCDFEGQWRACPSTRDPSRLSQLPDPHCWFLVFPLQDREHIPPHQQRVTCSGKQLEDGRTLYDYGIENQSIVHVLLRLCGGGKARPGKLRQDLAELGITPSADQLRRAGSKKALEISIEYGGMWGQTACLGAAAG
jgi:hypothetical protein